MTGDRRINNPFLGNGSANKFRDNEYSRNNEVTVEGGVFCVVRVEEFS
jgi:hypothetical protein